MVDQRKLGEGVSSPFPPTLAGPWREASVANKGDTGKEVCFEAVFGLPNLTKFYHFLPKTCTERVQRWQIRADNGGFLRPILLKRVESRGSCQSIIGAHFVTAKERPTQRHSSARWPQPKQRPQRGHRGHGEEVPRLTARLLLAPLCSLRDSSALSVLESFFFARERSRVSPARGKVCEANLLIRQWLLAKFRNRRSSGMLNSKDLLATLPASIGPPLRVLSGD